MFHGGLARWWWGPFRHGPFFVSNFQARRDWPPAGRQARAGLYSILLIPNNHNVELNQRQRVCENRHSYLIMRSIKKWDVIGWRRKQKEKKKRDKKRWDLISHIRCATATKVVVRRRVEDSVNHAYLHQNPFRGFGSLRGRNLAYLFLMLSTVAYTTFWATA